MVQERFRLRHLSGGSTWIRARFFASIAWLRLDAGAAFGVLRQLLADPRHQFVPDDLSCADRVVRTDLMAGANQITDRYLVALTRQHRFSLATLDEPLARSFAGEPDLVELVH